MGITSSIILGLSSTTLVTGKTTTTSTNSPSTTHASTTTTSRTTTPLATSIKTTTAPTTTKTTSSVIITTTRSTTPILTTATKQTTATPSLSTTTKSTTPQTSSTSKTTSPALGTTTKTAAPSTSSVIKTSTLSLVSTTATGSFATTSHTAISVLPASVQTSTNSVSIAQSSVVSSTSSTTTGSSSASASSVAASVAPSAVGGASVANTVLILAPDAGSVYTSTSGLNGYGIPFQTLIVPQAGVALPTLNSSSTQGNFGGIIVYSEVSYDYGGNWSSALTAGQWQQLYNYQTSFNVRMVRLNVFPGVTSDTTVVNGGCCNSGVEQLLSFTDTSAFPGASLVKGATVSTEGLYHYPASITNTTTTKAIAQFDGSSDNTYPGNSVAAVINTFGTREQMVWFTSLDTSWSLTSNFVQHSWIHWMTRSLFAGRRKTILNTQIDDVHLITDIYSPNGSEFRIRYQDIAAHIPWMASINSRLPAGSNYFMELGHNGNGDIENATDANSGQQLCKPDNAIEYADQIDTALEFQKPLGTGTNIWPNTPENYTWSLTCAESDPLADWFTVAANRDAFSHISHTFSHMALNNATYSDANKEIYFNIAWLKQVGIWNAAKFSPNGLIPPAITGLHNGDCIRAWKDNGINVVVGDNTRPILMNPNNEFWPLITNMSVNGYDGLVVMPRWATTIYYNCDLPACTLAEWIATSAGSGDFANLLNDARTTNVRHLLSLHQDPYMFHQANLRNIDVPASTVGSQSGQLSLLQIWVETIVQEFTRLTTWPVVTEKHDDLGQEFINRMARDACGYNLAYNYGSDGSSVVSVTVTANGNKCSTPIPVTVPGDASVASGTATRDKLGNDLLVLWVTLSGSPVTINLSSPVSAA